MAWSKVTNVRGIISSLQTYLQEAEFSLTQAGIREAELRIAPGDTLVRIIALPRRAVHIILSRLEYLDLVNLLAAALREPRPHAKALYSAVEIIAAHARGRLLRIERAGDWRKQRELQRRAGDRRSASSDSNYYFTRNRPIGNV